MLGFNHGGAENLYVTQSRSKIRDCQSLRKGSAVAREISAASSKSRPFRGQRVRKGANMDAGKSLQLKDAIKERGESTSIFYSQAVVANQSSMPMQNIPKVRQDFIPPYSTLQESHPASFSVLRSSKIEKPCNCVVSSILSIFFLFPTASAQSATTDDIGSTSNFLRQRRLQHLLHTLLHLIQFGQ